MEKGNETGQEINPILQKDIAVSLFCLAKRHPSSIEKLDKAIAKYPEVIKIEKMLLRRFADSRCDFADSGGCYALTVQLRDASGFRKIIALKNPLTSKWE
jgi:hypothetical protein